MLKQILWNGLFYHSVENCFIKNNVTGTEIVSSITSLFEDIINKVDYVIKINHNWETEYFSIQSEVSGEKNMFTYESDGKGGWTKNGNAANEFLNCIDIDISLTPFTNSLPINRLKLKNHEEQLINVIYIDILQQRIKTVQQKYKRLSKYEYRYQNVPNDFETIITVDE
ncbi:MAG: putative glycolipid-binding domain-containing protein [Ginsengibacter sp.]